eukprot:3785856-Rhodomonas_salina.1
MPEDLAEVTEHDDFHTPEALSYASSVRDEEDGDGAHLDFFSAEEADSLECSDAEDQDREPEFGLNALEALARGLIGRSPGKYARSEDVEANRHVNGHGTVFPTAMRRLLPNVEEFPGEDVSSEMDVQAESANTEETGRIETSAEEGLDLPLMPKSGQAVPLMPRSSHLGPRLPSQGAQGDSENAEGKVAKIERNGLDTHHE